MVYIPVSAVKGTPHNRFQRGVLHTTDTTDVNTLEVSCIIHYACKLIYWSLQALPLWSQVT